MTDKSNFPEWWDPYSCQPYKLKDREKPRFCLSNLAEYSKIGATTLTLLPAVAYRYARLEPAQPTQPASIAGLSLNTDPEWRSAQRDLVEELGVKHLLIRISNWETRNLDSIVDYTASFREQDFVVNILQDRQSVRSESGWQQQLHSIFDAFQPHCSTFKIGNAVNRSKWGCRHSGDAVSLFRIADQVRRKNYPNLKLLGSSVIDFEPLITLRTLCNFANYKYDGCAALLYINRRGSAYGKQYGIFDLQNKLRLIKAILSLSNNTENKLWITEINWPLLNTKPYTPNSGHPRSTVDEKTQAEYLTQFFNIAAHCGWVERVYWWQLIHPGYGLVDHRRGGLRKMPSFYAFRDFLGAENSTAN